MATDPGPVRTVLQLVGSPVDEFFAELSRLYARASIEALADSPRYRMHVAYVAPGGCWSFPADLAPCSLAAASPMSLPQAISHIERLSPDVMVPQMFCRPGMTVYRSLFDTLGVPYLGSSGDVMAVGADKAKARAIVAAAGVRVPAGRVVRDRTRTDLSYPVVVKPVSSDNSVGVTLVTCDDDYERAVDDALAHDDAALVETFVPLGREVRCGILVRDGELIGLPLEEYAVDAAAKPIRTREDKLDRDGDGELQLMAKSAERAWIVPTDDPVTQRVWAAARRCHRALGCRDYSLFDFRIDPSGEPWFLEAGLYCSFAPSSVVATMASAAGVDLGRLFEESLAELAGR
ncbi:D-alanine--D-alanine ligase [Mycolicibacterium iranicum]|uniref:D-alanine--D-alanine ligase n=1 Tax=Mycolicibacterium iranicum TaxID=912594 RepID=A0ABT4HJG9_MYCIR|nr:D-alanine--D-alanine ligase [Mycolicibacterium iranicum]MCZ0730363.1 D-alanine--D-alanine ligase [Mycolicibacterium iranicum]